MKHIKKRFFLEYDNPESLDQLRDTIDLVEVTEEFDHRTLDSKKKSLAFLITESEKTIGGFVHKVDGKNYIFPLPDPTLIYFHNAQAILTQIKSYKAALLKKLDFKTKLSESAINEIYHYYGVTSGFVIFLFTSVESFINSQVPDNFYFKKELKNKTEIYNKQQIQENLDFNTKLKEVLSQATGKNFFARTTNANQMIYNLRDFRNSIIHTKQENQVLRYDGLIKKSLTFNYAQTLEAVAKFMNYYKSDYIVECECGVDF